VGAGQNVLLHLERANGVEVNQWRIGPGEFEWGGKRFGTDTLTVCVDQAQDGTCDAPGVESTATWTQYPAIVSYKNATSDMARALFSNGVMLQFTMNAVCNPGGAFFSRQTFLTMNWTDAGGPHRFVADYMSAPGSEQPMCVVNSDGGLDQTIFGWGRLETGVSHPFKIIIRTKASGAPLELRFGVGNAPAGLDWDFLNGVMKNGKLMIVPGA
jgi:hypothetical protein